MAYQNLVLVEGKNDSNVVGHLFIHAGIPYEFNETALNKNPRKIFIKAPAESGGIDPLIKNLPFLISAETQNIAIIIDKDQPSNSKWHALKNKIIELSSSTANLPEEPISGGIIQLLQVEQHSIKLGIWVMPDNTNDGALEEFLAHLIPQTERNQLWQYTDHCIEKLPERKFAKKDTQKARLHTWLAWQEVPGLPYGTSISAKFLDAGAPLATTFIQWIKNLFGEELTTQNHV